MKVENLEEEPISKLANFIMTNIAGEPSKSEGAVDTAIRLLRKLPEYNKEEDNWNLTDKLITADEIVQTQKSGNKIQLLGELCLKKEDFKTFIQKVKEDSKDTPTVIMTPDGTFDSNSLNVGFEAGVKHTLNKLDKRAGDLK